MVVFPRGDGVGNQLRMPYLSAKLMIRAASLKT